MPTSRIPAPHLPVAQVLPLLPLAHLDRAFDYHVKEEQHDIAQPGVKVRIFFHGRRVDGIILSRSAEAEYDGKLAWIEKVISPEVVLPPDSLRLVEAVAERYAGTRSDVIRLAIPPRHAGAESSDTTTAWEELGSVTEPDLSDWLTYRYGESFVDAVLAGQPARAVWQWIPHDSHMQALAALATKVAAGGGGVLIVVPDQKTLDRTVKELKSHVGAKQITELSASLGPQARYRRFLSILHGQGRLVVGTRSAMFAPVHNLRLCVLLDDGNDNLVDRLSPYPHAREVLATRSAHTGCAFIIGGFARTAEAQLLVETGWAHELVAPREVLRSRMPLIRASGDNDFEMARDPLARVARIPRQAFDAMRKALADDRPVLVQVPRTGYMPSLQCGHCRTPARCRHCHGPLAIPSGSAGPGGQDYALPECRWCGRPDGHYVCNECGQSGLRAHVTGAARTAEELGRAFPQIPVLSSGGSRVLDEVPAKAALVISTPGAEPRVAVPDKDTDSPDAAYASYGAAVFLDTWALLMLQDLRATERALKRWLDAAALVAPHDHGGQVVIMADPALPVVQRLIRFDAAGAAAAELATRRDTELPPSVSMAAIDGPGRSLDAIQQLIELPPGSVYLGPTDLPLGVKLPGEYDEKRFGPAQRLLVRAPISQRAALARALKHAMSQRAAQKDELPIRLQVNPIQFG
ncbi:primosomal protein N' [Corynebacterium aquilae]|uniref:Probable replication restart protein PriA n=1 Tax=Corynebacterium aquilae DSM 44791 TaxID=1431546 RepID=A0A1L7CG74_9CORY|nr:primosomal protein N' [Corynebacterium aquilae]APT84825.1 primosome assembly protein PriA [Corynebacterium aquilae DSM 44791]